MNFGYNISLTFTTSKQFHNASHHEKFLYINEILLEIIMLPDQFNFLPTKLHWYNLVSPFQPTISYPCDLQNFPKEFLKFPFLGCASHNEHSEPYLRLTPFDVQEGKSKHIGYMTPTIDVDDSV